MRYIYRVAMCVCVGIMGLYALDASKAQKLLESSAKRSLEVISFTPIEGSSLFLLLVQDKRNGYRTLLISDEKQENISVASAFFSSNSKAMERVGREIQALNTYNANVQNSAKLNALFQSIPNEYKITIIGANPKLLYIVTDPMCPHCQEELTHIESRLQTHTLVIIPVGLLGQESLYKAAEIARTIRSATTPKEQINILKSIYATSHRAPSNNDDAYKSVVRVSNIIRESKLIEGVPFIYEAL